MNTSDIVIGDNLFKLPPKSAKSTRGRNKQLVTYDYDTTQKLFNSREFRLKIGLISCTVKHIVAEEYDGSIEFTINELWTACGNQGRLYNPKDFEGEVLSFLKKLNTVSCNFSNFTGYTKAKRIVDRLEDGKLKEDLNSICENIYIRQHVKTPYFKASLRSYHDQKSGKDSKLIHVSGIPVEVAYMILTKSMRTINGEEFLKPLNMRIKDNVFLIATLAATRIKHDEFNRQKKKPLRNSNEILTSHFYDIVDANDRHLQAKVRKTIEAVFDSYVKIGKISGWNWSAKGTDKYYKIVFEGAKNKPKNGK